MTSSQAHADVRFGINTGTKVKANVPKTDVVAVGDDDFEAIVLVGVYSQTPDLRCI